MESDQHSCQERKIRFDKRPLPPRSLRGGRGGDRGAASACKLQDTLNGDSGCESVTVQIPEQTHSLSTCAECVRLERRGKAQDVTMEGVKSQKEKQKPGLKRPENHTRVLSECKP